MKINGSLARQCIADLEEKGMIRPVVTHSRMKIYSTGALFLLDTRNSDIGS
jgi:small subunit ribosomal protein S25e